MIFFAANLILTLLSLYMYVYFRCGIYSYCRVKKMSKTYIRKNTKGASNYWLYSQLHKQCKIGIFYYINIIYLFSFFAFLVAFSLSWISFLRIPIIIVGVFLGIVAIPAFFLSLIYTNIEDVGQPFVIFKIYKGFNGRKRSYHAIIEWLFAFIPISVYIFLLT